MNYARCVSTPEAPFYLRPGTSRQQWSNGSDQQSFTRPDAKSEIPYRLSEIRYSTDTFRTDNSLQFAHFTGFHRASSHGCGLIQARPSSRFDSIRPAVQPTDALH